MFEIFIPEISDKELLKRYDKIKPIVSINGQKYYLRDYSLSELRNTSYIWNKIYDIRQEANGLKPIPERDFYCIHKYGYYSLFKPSVCEVLSQIDLNNPNLNSRVKAFEIIEYPETISDFGKDGIFRLALYNGFHVSKVRLYE